MICFTNSSLSHPGIPDIPFGELPFHGHCCPLHLVDLSYPSSISNVLSRMGRSNLRMLSISPRYEAETYQKQGSLYYQPKQCTIFWGKSLQITIQLHCSIPSKMGHFNDPLQKPIAKLMQNCLANGKLTNLIGPPTCHRTSDRHEPGDSWKGSKCKMVKTFSWGPRMKSKQLKQKNNIKYLIKLNNV